MSNKFKIVLLLVLSGLLITGCNDKKKRSAPIPQGNVVFYHNIDGMGELLLKAVNTSERNSYGTVDFQKFTNAVFLNAGGWSVDVINSKGTTTTLDDELLTSGDFTVAADSVSLVAITEGANSPYKIHTLPLASGAINISHLDKDLAAVDIYIVPEQAPELPDPATPNINDLGDFKISGLEFSKTSKNVTVTTDNGVYIYIVDENSDLIYQSGLRELGTSINQTLLINKNADVTPDSYSLIYFFNGKTAVWNHIDDRNGKVRIVNAYGKDSPAFAEDPANPIDINFPVDSAIEFQPNPTPSPASNSLSVSDYKLLASSIKYNINSGIKWPSSPNYLPALPLSIEDGEQWSVIFFGDSINNRLLAFAVKETKSKVVGQSTITVSNAAYFRPDGYSELFNVYIKAAGDDDNASIANMIPRSYISKRFVADGSTTYSIRLASALNDMTYYTGSITPVSGENYSLVIYGDFSSGFRVCTIDENTCE